MGVMGETTLLREMFLFCSAEGEIDLIWESKGRLDDILPTGNWCGCC